ncbi:MAG: ZIP family metal transporter [Spirochaetes bacterium]|nr:ZIP family metal transporter [Spirochaetota bacterium]
MDGIVRLFESVTESRVLQGLIGGLIITAFNMTGALLVLVMRRVSDAFLDVALGFAAGVMLTASYTSLILPGVEIGGVLPVLAGIALGALLLGLGDRIIPHTHFFMGKEGANAGRIRGVWLFIIAITLHNMPEGLAVSLSSISAGLGSRYYATMVGIRAGLVEIPLALLGAWAVSAIRPMLPYAMGFAAGAMLYVISDEIIPETHRKGHERLATIGTLVGVCVMLFLDVSFG